MRTIDRLTDEKGKSYPVYLDPRTGTFHVTVSGKIFKDGNLIKLKKAALARLTACSDSKIEWKPFITINLSEIDHYDFSLCLEYERRFFGTLDTGDEVWCYWGANGKPEGDPRSWNDLGYDVIRISYTPKHWNALGRFGKAFNAFAHSIHNRLKVDAKSFLESLLRIRSIDIEVEK